MVSFILDLQRIYGSALNNIKMVNRLGQKAEARLYSYIMKPQLTKMMLDRENYI